MQLTKTLGCECLDYPYTLLLGWHLLLYPLEKTTVCHHMVEAPSVRLKSLTRWPC